ncbi:hypothetical protein RFI_34244 [Reticulomyxa filosa]|uniref:Uncharacterized protein n=1 Tax=Reticulomyxa filosa TaxID=46433 RepID=X6LPT2_RETFI|nr:hypothetical protein RFI_34244 [Reticulomyxa filosa]|eukprot:ETO03167.1 hypothetical protein RFI_34244 [Reticulomyxa filosa]
MNHRLLSEESIRRYYVSFEELEEILPAEIEDLVMYYYKQMQEFPHTLNLHWRFHMNPPYYKILDIPTVGKFILSWKRVFYYSYDHQVNLYTIYGTLDDGRYYFDQKRRHKMNLNMFPKEIESLILDYKEHLEKYEKLKKIEGQLMTRKQVRYFNYETFIISSTPLSCNCMRCQIYRGKKDRLGCYSLDEEGGITIFGFSSDGSYFCNFSKKFPRIINYLTLR